MATYWENSCSFGLRYVFISTYVPDCYLIFPTSVFGVGISFWLRLYLIIAYFFLYIIHSASILELSTNLFLKFYKSAFGIDVLLSTTILLWYCQFDVSPVNYFDSDQLGHFMLDTKCILSEKVLIPFMYGYI